MKKRLNQTHTHHPPNSGPSITQILILRSQHYMKDHTYHPIQPYSTRPPTSHQTENHKLIHTLRTSTNLYCPALYRRTTTPMQFTTHCGSVHAISPATTIQTTENMRVMAKNDAILSPPRTLQRSHTQQYRTTLTR